ncbi:hypothetical protein U9M48_010855 [Paspalum notatum var. saurae]|uniref:Uncharacterized protein n=1 Tax=Paspalum notatum var. saurae TaxID=547442 RepID=A0AAQ3WGP4_PASNO
MHLILQFIVNFFLRFHGLFNSARMLQTIIASQYSTTFAVPERIWDSI